MTEKDLHSIFVMVNQNNPAWPAFVAWIADKPSWEELIPHNEIEVVAWEAFQAGRRSHDPDSEGIVIDPPYAPYDAAYAVRAMYYASPDSDWRKTVPELAPRSPGWEKLAREFLAANPHCAVCGTKVLVVPHHVKPFHLFPELELDVGNLIGLCPPHHLLFGHLMNWRSYNPDAHEDARLWASRIRHRPTA